MQAQTKVAESVEVIGSVELSLEPQAARPLVAQPTANLPATVVTPADLLRVAMETGNQDIDRLERLMQMDIRYREQQALEHQRRREELEQDRQRAAVMAFREDFIGFRAENIIVPLTKHVDRGAAGSFEQAEYHRVTDMLTPALARHGFGFRHKPDFTSRKWVNAEGVEQDIPWVIVTCYLEHRKTHVETVVLEGPSSDLRGCTPMQNMQATASYLKRHSLLAITGTATGGEDDENNLKPKTDASTKADPAEDLLDAGRAAALEGVQALTAWWNKRSAREQKDLGKDYLGMRKAARIADEGRTK